MKESLILCEGFDDRDFLAGWLQHANGWSDPTDGGRELPPTFGGGKPERGVFYFDDPSGVARVGILQAGGRAGLTPRIKLRLEGFSPLRSLVVVADPDHDVDSQSRPVIDLVRQALVADGFAANGPPPWTVGNLHVEVVEMAVGTHAAAELDAQERLERLVTAAFAEAHPDRYSAMLQWLNGRPRPSGSTAMAMHWSAMAAWFPDTGGADYLRRAIWQDPPMAKTLRRLVGLTGLDVVTQRLASS